MFKSRLEAYVNPLIDVRISSAVENGNSHRMSHLIMFQKLVMSRILPFFALISHCLVNLFSTTSLSLTGIAYGLARIGTASGFKQSLTGLPV